MKELILNEIDTLIVKPGEIQFPEYRELKRQAQQVADYLETVEVTEENVKENKKLLAAVNKSVKKLEDERIGIKKKMLIPYTKFESEVKEIVEIVKKADTSVRAQVKSLEEKEREEKYNKITELFGKRISAYDFDTLFNAEDFIKPEHLNKSLSITKIEAEMVEWLTKIETDIFVINGLEHADEVMAEYREIKDLATAMSVVTERHNKVEEIKKVAQPVSETQKTYRFEVFTAKDMKMTEMFMNENQIEYKKDIK